MKNTLKMIIAVLSLAAMLFAVSCGQKTTADTTGGTTAAEPQTSSDPGTTVPDTTEEPATEPDTTEEPETEPVTETDPVPSELTDGVMVYYEDFSSYGDVEGKDGVISALGWRVLTVGEDGAPSDWTAELTLKDGALHVRNYSDDGSFKGSDGYALILDDAYMARVEKYGTYTLQYDVTYGTALNHKRYLNFVTEYGGGSYNSYHFRVGGYGNNQIYANGNWFTYDAADEDDLFAAQKKTTEDRTTIAYKLLGRTEEPGDNYIDMFKDVTVTVRVIRGKERADILMKTADMEDFVRVSKYNEMGDAYGQEDELTGSAVCFKTGGAINGYVDNIAIWTGDGDMPADRTVTYVP